MMIHHKIPGGFLIKNQVPRSPQQLRLEGGGKLEPQ